MSESTNPLIAGLKLPGRIFQLPSRGLFYKNGELDESVVNGEIHVRPMSAIDEINMKNPDQLFSGEAVNAVFKQCIDGINKPSELLSKDIDAIMFFLRTVTYGPNYEFSATHTCEGAKNHSYVADIEQMIAASKMLDPTTLDNVFKITLNNGQVVKLRPNRYSEVIKMIKANGNKNTITAEDEKNILVMSLLGIIESVDGISDTEKIEEWVKMISQIQVNRISEKIGGLADWGTSSRWTTTCKDCGKEYIVDIPINPVSFFTE